MRQIDATPNGSYRVSQGRRSVLVGIMDTGIDASHPDVAPKVQLVNIHAGRDSGFFFPQPTVDAMVYAGLVGIDVINMSFFTDPWLYNCLNNPADSPEAQSRAAHHPDGHPAVMD